MNNDNLRRVHKTLLDNGYTPPTYEEFENDMQDDNNLRGVYETLKKEGYTPPEYEQFKSDMGFAKVDANPNVNHNADPKPNGDADAKPWEAKVAGVPSLYDIADKQREETSKMPNYRHEVSVDEEGGKISKPVVKMSAIGNTPQVAPVFKDYAGNEYDATDPKVLEEAKRQVAPIVNTPKAQEEPSLLESIGKSIGAGAVRAGTQMIDVLQQLSSNMYVEDPSSPTGFTRTQSYEEQIKDENNPLTQASSAGHTLADKWSKEAQPRQGKGFVDLIMDGDITGALQKGVATAGESLPTTLSWATPYTAILNAIGMAGGNYREYTLEDESIPAWKRASMAIGSAAFEQAVEKYADPVFKYIGGTKILKGAAKEASKEIVEEVTKNATETLAKRIYKGLTNVGKDALGEGAEEVVTTFGNDALGEVLDYVEGSTDYGVRAQWEKLKKENPNANLWDFSKQKAKEYGDSFIGGYLSGAYTSGTAQVTTKALQYATGAASEIDIEGKRGTKIVPPVMDVAQAFDNGYSLEGQEMNDAMNMYDMQREKAVQVLGEDKVAELDAHPVDAMVGIDTEEQLQVATDYVNAKATFDGMGQKVLDDIDTQIAESEKNLNELTSKTDGKIHPVTLKGERKAHIVDGNVAVTDNGEIDAANSDLSILVRDDETGKIEFVSPSDIVTSDGAIDAEEEKANVAQAIRDAVTQQADAQMSGILPFNVGDQYDVLDDEGNAHTIAVVDNGQEGQVLVSVDGENVARMMPRDEVQKMANNANLARLAAHEAKKETKRQMEIGETSGEADNNNVGANEPLAATSQNAMPMMGEEPDFLATTPERGHRYLYNEAGIPKAAADNMVTAHINAAEKEVKKQSDALAKLDANPGTSISAYKAKQADIKGKLDAAQAAYDYWNGVKVEQGKSEEAERQAAFAAQTADASGRQNELAAQKTPKEKIDAAKQMYGEHFDSDFAVPYDAMELVAMNMPNEKISWEGREGVRGLQQELGSNFKRGVGRDKGTNAFNIYLAKKGEGISTDEAIHSIYESAENTLPNGEHRWDVEEIRGAFIDMFMSAEKPSDIRDYVLNNRIRQAEQMRAAEDEAAEMARLDDEIMQRTGMEREEYAAWIAELEARADAQAAYENEVYNETNTSNDRETEGSIGEESSGQVQGQEGDTTGVEEDGTASRRGRRGENIAGDRVGEEEVEAISHEEAISLIAKMEEIATVAPDVELTIENWDAIFGEEGRVVTPIGEVKMGESQFTKLMRTDRSGKLGMIKPTLENPHAIIEDTSAAKGDNVTERASSYVFIRSFKKADGSRYYYFTSVTVSKDGKEVVISNQEKSKKRISNLLQTGVIRWINKNVLSASETQNEESVLLDDSQAATQADNNTASLGVNSPELSDGKGTENSETDKETEQKFNKGERFLLASGAAITIEDVDDKGVRTFTWKSINNDNVHTSKATIEELEVMGARPLESVQEVVSKAEEETDTNPTEGQKKAGNYKKGHVKIDGYNVSIEQPKGSVRSGVDANGKKWEQTMNNTYGYIRGTEGVDGDHIDVFLSDNLDDWNGMVYVVDQVNNDGSFDEHKVMYGFNSAEEARAAYLSNYEEGWQGLGVMTGVTKEEFKKWVESSHRKTKPFAEYKSVQKEEGQNESTINGAVDKIEKAKPKETASIKEVVRNYVQVYRNWADDIKNDAALKAWQNARKELEGRLNELSDEELEGLKSQLGGDFANIADFVGDISRRRTQNREVSNAFDEGMKAQKEISGTAKAPKVVLDNFTANDELRPVLNGVHHDEDGFAVATNGMILIADKRQYDEANKGKTIISHKVGNSAKKGDIVDFRFPNWKMVVKAHPNGSTASVTFDGLRKFLAGVEEVMKSRWNTEKENGNTKQSFASWSSEANIAIRMPNGEVCVYKYNRLSKFADAAANMGMTDIYYAADRELIASNENGYVLLMPTNPNILSEEESLSYDAGRRFFYEWNSSSADRLHSKPNEQGKTETEKPQKSEKKSSARASSVVKIDDFGEKIGGARKDLARGRIRDIKGYTTKDLTTLKKGADDILSQANILRLYKDGQMDEQTARGFLAMNNAVKVAIKKYGRTAKEIILNKYRDAAVAWEEGRAAEFGITDADVAAYMAGFDITEEKARKDLDYCITETFDMYMLTYQAMNYPAVERKLGQYVIVDYGSMRSRRIPLSRPFWVKTSYTSGRGYPFATLEGAMEKLNQLCPEVKPKDTEKKEKGEKAEHGLRVTKEGFGFYVKSRNIPGNIYLSPKFTSEKQAQAYMEENLEQLKAREQRLVDALMGSNIGMAEREGVDYRNGKDVTPQDFLDEFGFRGVEFGNWVPQGERQMYLNKTYDAIKDFCAIVGISPKAFSLGGRLGLAFGARGSGRALAHYEPGKEAINLTRMSGVGSLAHEWFHALDNILAKQETGNTSDMATTRYNVVREEVSAMLKEMYRVMKAMDYDVRSRRAGEYWGRTEEEFARLFQNYIYNKLAEKEVTSPILVRQDILFDDAEEISKNRWPYPSVAENATMAPLFDKLFSTIQEKTDEKGNVVLFQKLDGSTLSKEADATEMMMRDALIETMEGAGIEVVTDVAIGQQVLDENANATREMRVYHGSGADFDAFDHSHMGEGEGAQAYGWGTYVTEVEGIGKTYAQSVGQNPIGRRPVLYKGEAYDVVNTDGWSDEKKGVYVDLVQGMRVMGKSAEQAKDDLRLMTEVNIRNRERSLANLEDSSENYQDIAEDKRKQEERLKHINEFNADDFTREGSTPTLYTVEIPEENAAYYIGYNERMREQKEIVEMADNELAAQGWRRQEIGEQMVFTNSEGKRIVFTPNQTGADFYEEFVVAFGSKKAASEFLSSVGITGIKYPAEFRSGGRTDGASNYVIFDERDLEITNKARLFRTSNGEVYGYTMGGKIYLDTRIATTETPIHEYSHLWSEALEQANPKAWEQLKNDLVKDTELMDYVKGLYPEIKDENELMHEVFAHFSGKRGRARLEEMRKEETEKANGLLDKARIIAMFHRLKELLGRYWTMARDLFAGSVKGLKKMKAEDFADMAMADLMGGFNPGAAAKNNDIRYQFVGEQGAAEAVKMHYDALAQKYHGKPYRIVMSIDEMADEDFLKEIGITDEELAKLTTDEIRENAKEQKEYTKAIKIGGGYNPNTGKIVIFAENIPSLKEIEDTFFHENLHGILHELYGDNPQSIALRFWDAAEKWSDKKSIIAKAYRNESEHRQKEEFFVYLLSRAMLKGRVDDVLSVLTEEDTERVENILGILGYDRQTEELERRREKGNDRENHGQAQEKLGQDVQADRHRRTVDVAEGGKLYRQPAFYSNAERAVEGIKQEKATPEQWLAMIQKAGGLKAGEDKWMGLSDWLRQQGQPTTDNGQPKAKTLTKQEVLDFIRSNRVEVEEVNYAEESKGDETAEKEFFVFTNDTTAEAIVLSGKKGVSLSEASRELLDERYGEGWEDYVYIDSMGFVRKGEFVTAEEAAQFFGVEYDKAAERAINSTRIDYTTEGLENKKEIALVVPTIEPWNEGDEIHFGDAGGDRAVAWVRFGETTDADGKRVLVIDEIQSKRHQEGREKGYANENTISEIKQQIDVLLAEQEQIAKDILHKKGYIYHDEEGGKFSEKEKYYALTGRIGSEEQMARQKEIDSQLYELNNKLRNERGGIPDAPFDKNWHELAMKRMLRYAAENGYDKIAWTKGAQQADRYNLSKVFNSIEREDNPNEEGKRFVFSGGNYEVMRVDDSNKVIYSSIGESEGKNLDELVGKDLAIKMMGMEDGDAIDSEEIRIGGEGMMAFYDQMLPRFMDKYGKKWGVKTTEVELPEVEEAGETMWAVDVTPEMRESVMEGQPMFREGGVLPTYEESLASSKAAGYTKKQHDAWWNRAHKNMRLRANDIAKKLHLEGVVDIYETADDLNGVDGITEEDKKSKGWYDPKTGRIAIILGNHASAYDVMMTMLHEGVAHYGLRKLFGKNFETFLWNVYSNATPEVRSEINKLMAKNGWNYETATEEYLAGLAEDIDFDRVMKSGWWWKIKDWFVKMLRDIGLGSYVPEGKISDNELRYVLWRSYYNLELGGAYGTLLGAAIDVAKQYELGVGKFAPKEEVLGVAESGIGMSLEETNRRFNDELANLSEENADWVNLSLGMPSPILLAAGVENKHMKLYGNKVIKKMKKHGFALNELRDLPVAVANPIAVFNNYGKDGNRSILTELKTAQGNILVAITIGRGDVDVDFNVVSSVFAKNNISVVEWINKGYATYINKEKALNYLHHSAPIAEALSDSRLSSAAKVVENFVNPKISAENVEKNAPKLHRSGDGTPRAMARDTYERLVMSGTQQFREAVQDSMLSLKNLYKSILKAEGKEKHIKDVAGYENAYLAENRMHSASQAQISAWTQDFFTPIVEEVYRLVGDSKSAYEELNDYLMAKHGLERNIVLAERDARKEYDRLMKAGQPADLNSLIKEYREKDYSGLTALTGENNTADAELLAQQMVDDFEASHDTTKLWARINAATKSSLEKMFRSGLMSKARYEDIRDMFAYYIPLQGFDEKVAEDMYAYVGSDGTRMYGTPIRSARGRRSKADNPLATIAMNGEAAIRQGNRNEMKQHFLNFVQAHPSDVVSVSDVWLRYNDVTDEWEQYFDAGLKDDDSPEEVERKVRDFNERMEQLAASNPDRYKRGRDAEDIPFRVVSMSNASQHQVIVKRGGKTIVLTINGNPRAAQALNGLTNPDVFTEGVFGKAMNLGQNLNRLLSSLYTTRNPEFVASNYTRDALYSNCMTWVKESPAYAVRFHKNFGMANPAFMATMFVEWENGELRKKVAQMGNTPKQGSVDYMRKQFYDFMMNGGETGWTSLRDIEAHKKDLEASLKKEGSTSRKAWKALGGTLDIANRAVENCARFSAFVTSREMGRSLERSIYDAKEVSVNFNKKGAGDKFLSAKGQTKLGKAGSVIGGLGRGLFVFFNAGVQGMANYMGAAKHNPAKLAVLSSLLFGLGSIIPIVTAIACGGDDDDEDSYYNLPEYVRRSNLCFRWRKDMPWIKIPLPIEFRAMYGLGELSCGVLTGKERYTDEELTKQYISQVSQVLPLDFMEGGGGWHAFVPSSVKPVVEAYTNKGWTGLPIYKDNKFKEYYPQWTRAYESADKTIVEATRWLNEATGGSDVSQGMIDWNPARIEYMLKGYLGGYYTMFDRLKKSAETAFGKREFEWRNVPIASRFVQEGDERTEARKAKSEYFDLHDEYEKTKSDMNGFKKIAESGRDDAQEYAERLSDLENSQRYVHFQIMENYKPILDAYNDMIKEAEGEYKEELKAEEDALRRELIELIHAVDDEKEVNIEEQIKGDLDVLSQTEHKEIKNAVGRVVAKQLGGEYRSSTTEYGKAYEKIRNLEDLTEDLQMQIAIGEAEDSDDVRRERALDKARRDINTLKQRLGDSDEDDEKTMRDIRERRRDALKEFGKKSKE